MTATPYWDNGPVQLYKADARSIPLAEQSVHCVVTSPPYFGLRVYKDNDDRGIGLESTVEDYIGNLVDVFREVRRVLRNDGVAWLNLGDSYASDTKGTGGPSVKQLSNAGSRHEMTRHSIDVTSGNRLGIPERVVLALQADGWIWRDTIIWAKKSAMPESLAGWRWERCRVQTKAQPIATHQAYAMDPMTPTGRDSSGGVIYAERAEYEPCPGCPKCADNDGLVLRRGSWRTTQAHEYIYMMTKGMGYYADGEAVKTALTESSLARLNQVTFDQQHGGSKDYSNGVNPSRSARQSLENLKANQGGGANRRSVWNDISPEPYGGSHFATFPSDLPRICIQASTSERGCCSECGSQWARVMSTRPMRGDYNTNNVNGGNRLVVGQSASKSMPGDLEPLATLGWRPTCNHNAPAIPATVLDPFSGTATTCRAAQKLGRRAVGVDISESYLEQAVRRLSAVTLPMGL